MEKKRIAWMDMAKGLGILLVLVNHGELSLGPVTWLGGMFYMPIFFVLAGMTFSVREEESFGAFVRRKARRLLVPYALYNLFFFLLFFCRDLLLAGGISRRSFLPLVGILYSRNCLFPPGVGTNVNFMTVLNAPTWFLPCLFLSLLFYGGLWKMGKKKPRAAQGLGLFCVLLSTFLHYISPILPPWSLECALYAVGFLELGHQMRKHRLVERIFEQKWMLALLALAFVILARINGSVNMSVGNYGASMLLYLVVGGLGSLLAMELCYWLERRGKPAFLIQGGARVGQYTLRILCLHLLVFSLVSAAASLVPYVGGKGPLLSIWMAAISLLLLVPGERKKKGTCVLWLLLFTWFLPTLQRGIDVQDTCFYLTNYRYVFTPAVQVNELYYLFGEVLGGLVYHLAPGWELLALNVACGAVYTGVALLIYGKLRDKMPRIPLLLCVLAGSLFAITWVHCVNWNAWSALFVTLGAWLLLYSLERGSKGLLLGAGFVLGLNAFVRMPNILFLSLVAVVFWHAWMQGEEKGEKRVLQSLKACLPMVLGGALAGLAGIGISLGLLGPEKFGEDMRILTSLSQEGDLHSVTTGIYQFLMGLLDGLGMWVRYGGILLAAGLVLGVVRRRRLPGFCEEQQERCVLISALLTAGAFGWIRGWGEDILHIQVFVALGGIVLPGLAAWKERRRDLAFSCLCLTAMIIEGFLTIGTDTATIYYRIYMGLPLAMTVCILVRWLGRRVEWMVVPAFAIAFVLSGGVHYADTYIYHDGPKEELTETVDHPLFTGVYTTAERAECLNRLKEQLAPYEACELITIGNFTAAQAMTDMQPFFRSSWPDLDYLVDSLFVETLEEKLARGIYPVVIIATEEVNGPYWMPEKVEILEELVAREPYVKLYEDHLYSLYVPENGSGGAWDRTSVKREVKEGLREPGESQG